MTWRKTIPSSQMPASEDPRTAATRIEGLRQAFTVTADGHLCANLVVTDPTDTERSSVLLAAAAAALRELLQLPAEGPFSLTCQCPQACFVLRSIATNQLLCLVFRPEFPLSLAAYHAAELAETVQRSELRISVGSV